MAVDKRLEVQIPEELKNINMRKVKIGDQCFISGIIISFLDGLNEGADLTTIIRSVKGVVSQVMVLEDGQIAYCLAEMIAKDVSYREGLYELNPNAQNYFKVGGSCSED